ncbi:uncharacterized protein N7443_008744 [Penicillium atrosanguineum]|uniref:uncharacterized protein n=1 Tax=Penicillium atrosanguineum TaxID=1132637 RepID=UPI00238D8FCE|nr:uncharacterized protein N7443_008744 [Penicillium atrosanguineum]KAJ5292791.1 hypothetical protein N7443_008744 [Penicillium atrosanguineum]
MATGSLSPYFKPRLGPAPQGRPIQRPPLLMQRPQSSGIDTAGFSFAKPPTNQRGSSLRPPPKQGLINLNSPWAAATVEDQNIDDGQEAQFSVAKKLPARPNVEHQPKGLSHSGEDSSPHAAQDDPLWTPGPNHDKSLKVIAEAAAFKKNQSSKPATGSKARTDTVLPTGPGTDIDTEANTSRASSIRPTHDRHGGTTSGSPIFIASQSLIRPSNDYRVSKRCRQSQKIDQSARKHSFPGKPDFKPPSEEKLFELLIRRIRQREEQEAATVELQCQLEEQNLQLKDENQNLKQQLEADHEKLRKSVVELKECRTQMDHWKEKLRKFKKVVNELGKEYDILRDDLNKFKVAAESLEKEKSSLLQSIDGIRVQMARAEGIIDEQKVQLSEVESRAAVLRRSLEAAREVRDLGKSELINEKKRSAVLESYIQNCARNQTRQLLLIREDQRKLVESFDSGIQSLSEETGSSKEALLSEVRTCADQLCTSVEILSDKCTAERMEVQDFTDTVHDAVSRLDTMSTQFTCSIEAGTIYNANVSGKVQESLQLIERHLGAESTLLQQLGNCESSYESLKRILAAMEPTLSTLDISVQSLTTTESSLLRRLSELCEKLAEAQIQPSNPALELELSNKYAENTQLQLQLQEISLKSENLRQRLDEREAQTLAVQRSLTEVTAECQKAEILNQRIVTEKLAMQGEAALAEQKIRHELITENTTITDRIRIEYEQKLQTLQREKDDLEDRSEEVLVQLGGVRDSLVEAKSIVDAQRKDREALAEETGQHIQELTACYSEAMAKLDSQAMLIEQYQEVETVSIIEKSDIREQLKQAQEKIQEFERALVLKDGTTNQPERPTNIVPFAAFENRMSPDVDLSPYDDPADFAMLFITDESAPPSPAAKPIKPLPVNIESAPATNDLPRSVKDDKRVFNILENSDQTQVHRKRKAINFDAVPSVKDSKAAIRTNSGSMQAQEGLEDHHNKSAKHVHKFTYSRVHTTSTKIQQEQSTGPARPSVTERPTSPKGLVSASSGNHLADKPNTRSRGRRRSRGERYDARFSQEG